MCCYVFLVVGLFCERRGNAPPIIELAIFSDMRALVDCRGRDLPVAAAGGAEKQSGMVTMFRRSQLAVQLTMCGHRSS